MRAGWLRHRVVVQTLTRTPDGGGGFTESWADTATVWARVEALDGREAFEAMQVASSLRYRVTLRDRALTPTQRLEWGTKILKIRSITPDERGSTLTVLCDEEFI